MYFTGWVVGDEELSAIVCKLTGTRANLCVFYQTGGMTTAFQAPYDQTGQTPGSWRTRM